MKKIIGKNGEMCKVTEAACVSRDRLPKRSGTEIVTTKVFTSLH